MSTAVTTRPARTTRTLRGRLFQALTAGGIVLALIVAAAVLALWQMIDRQNQVADRYFSAITAAESAYTGLVDAETAVRGYALTGSEVTLEPYERVDEALDTFAEVAENADGRYPEEMQDAAGRALVAAQEWDERVAAPIIEHVAANGPAAVTPDEITAGQVVFDRTRDAVQHYLDLLADRRSQAAEQLDTWTQVVVATMAVLVFAAVVAAALLWQTLSRWITEPLNALAEDSRAVSSGDLHHRVETTGPGEIANLAADVEQMRLSLVAQLQSIEASRAEVAAAHEQLTEQAEELRRSNRDLEQFAYVASHDLQEPLRKVASFTQLLQKRYGGQLDERADQYIGFAVDGAKRMQALIQDLLGFSRVGRIGGEVTEVPMDAALAEALDNLGDRVEDTGAVVEADGLPVVSGERGLLVQLLQNLVGNAIKFHDPDRPPVVRLSAERVGDEWEFECRDNGIGIDPQYAERVFVIFQRLHPKDVYGGTGIGLALCKKIVEYHGGRIWLGDSEGPGTSIRWTLPAAAPDDNTPVAAGGTEE
ncbi:sensor histidine kinase [Cellulomonas denverensis]|uniref:histidine kinase n=1 Tax=Cellulomonas denverensis TaxID=264297 RepID=A0A7X6KW93_9CELL|nr:sensor histidine kinase [Cellulomonas denverensis]NKY23391.1 HAMP domain-containing protein [Cellulomonas denverensis]GIG25129.1 histidine kinase [Cellulomonas denverensis]